MMKDAGSTEGVDDENSDLYNKMVDPNYWVTSTDPNKRIYCLNYKGFSNDLVIDVTKEEPTLQDYSMGLYYPMSFQKIWWEGETKKTAVVNTYGTVGRGVTIKEHFNEAKELVDTEITSSTTTRDISGRKFTYGDSVKYKKLPYRISVYSRDFDTKAKTKAYLETWNSKDPVRIGPGAGDIVQAKDRTKITVPDNLTIVINMINGIITTTTVSLTIFASLSLVVSSVMIGIITYISVMERIKEIGVIRSLGGRKKDVSHLFNAETFILGTAAGLFGVLITYVFEIILDIAIYATYKIPMIANLKWWTALIMIVLSIVLTAISGLIPSRSAAKKDPVTALRSE